MSGWRPRRTVLPSCCGSVLVIGENETSGWSGDDTTVLPSCCGSVLVFVENDVRLET